MPNACVKLLPARTAATILADNDRQQANESGASLWVVDGLAGVNFAAPAASRLTTRFTLADGEVGGVESGTA